MRVLVLHSSPPHKLTPDRTIWEFELSAAAAFVAKQLRGSIVRAVEGRPAEIVKILNEIRPDVVFNLCEAPLGRSDLEAHVAAFLEWSGIRFTGCGSETLALCRRKDRTGLVLRAAGVAVPEDLDFENPRFPCVVKPAAEDGSAGIHDYSLCHNAEQLRFALAQLTSPALVQEFVPGREFAVCLWGRENPDNFSIGETTCAERPLITYEAKWDSENVIARTSPPRLLNPGVEELILQAARRTWKIVCARHALRIDIRLDPDDVPRVLDVNPNPAISPVMGICRAVQEAGWTWELFVNKLVEWA